MRTRLIFMAMAAGLVLLPATVRAQSAVTLATIADTSTQIPGGSGVFTGFIPSDPLTGRMLMPAPVRSYAALEKGLQLAGRG